MDDLISRQAAIEHFKRIIDATNTDSRYNLGFIDGLEFCIDDLSTILSTQPERKKGRWIDMGDHCVCDQCGHTESAQYDGVQPIPNFTPYCSTCGAKMEVEE